ncbi:MAG: hypothetical protein Q7R95_06725, partial [bacterium]|nr:hypothetical protein [bacterium]
TSFFLAVVSFSFLVSKSQAKNIILNFKNNSKLILSVSFIDNLAWVAFSYATLYIPIAIATSISESYIVIAAYLGYKINKEKLRVHQTMGFVLTILATIVLTIVT